jgi:hypothetical protein
VLNQINGLDHSGANSVGIPAIFGMNFQSVSTAQKLVGLVNNVVTGGYMADGTPGPLVLGALNFVNKQVGLFQAAIAASAEPATLIILTAK